MVQFSTFSYFLICLVARLNYVIKTKAVFFLLHIYECNGKNAGEHNFFKCVFLEHPIGDLTVFYGADTFEVFPQFIFSESFTNVL